VTAVEGEPSGVVAPDLADEITTLTGHLNAANGRFLALLGEFDRRCGWAEWSVKSCAHWLSWKCGISLGAAREKVRVAQALEKLPALAGAMSEGRISYAKVRAMTRVADTGNESDLLNIALHGTASHVEDVVRGYRRALFVRTLEAAVDSLPIPTAKDVSAETSGGDTLRRACTSLPGPCWD
jgi:hypothetical protein